MQPSLASQLPLITALCERYGVAHLELFGSATGPDFQAESSDYDFLVELDPAASGSRAQRLIDLADALEALLGAIFLDAGFATADAAIQRLFASRLSGTDAGRPRKDAKTTLQEWLQARRLPLPQYTVERIEGEAHRQVFHVRCEVPSQAISVVGQGASRRIAEQDAAACAFAILPNPALTQKS